jgi:hypothetical protein
MKASELPRAVYNEYVVTDIVLLFDTITSAEIAGMYRLVYWERGLERLVY